MSAAPGRVFFPLSFAMLALGAAGDALGAALSHFRAPLLWLPSLGLLVGAAAWNGYWWRRASRRTTR